MSTTSSIHSNRATKADWQALADGTLAKLENKYFVYRHLPAGDTEITTDFQTEAETAELAAVLPAMPISGLGSETFQIDHKVKCSYMAGAMAHGIASEEMVIALGKSGLLSSFGSGGLSLPRVEQAIKTIQAALPNGPYAFNFLSNPYSADYENGLVNLFLQYGINTVEASAFIEPSAALINYRIQGLSLADNGQIQANNKIIAKVSRQEVALKFLMPPSQKMIELLLSSNTITPQQAQWASQVPLADDITVEADSGGHTDNRPLISVLPAMIAIRNRVCDQQGYNTPVRIGAAGGIGTSESVLAAFTMGADYVVTGSINQGCIEAGTSDAVKKLLAKAKMADVTMAPAADMFEEGVKVQVLRSGTMFPMLSQKLYDTYRKYPSLDAIPEAELAKLEKSAFKKPVAQVWQETAEFFRQRDPKMLTKAEQDPKKKMSLVFRWYLGKSASWAVEGDPAQMINAQIWCGQVMGAFNEWVKGTPMEHPGNRKVAEVAELLMVGAALLSRIQLLRAVNVDCPLSVASPQHLLKEQGDRVDRAVASYST